MGIQIYRLWAIFCVCVMCVDGVSVFSVCVVCVCEGCGVCGTQYVLCRAVLGYVCMACVSCVWFVCDACCVCGGVCICVLLQILHVGNDFFFKWKKGKRKSSFLAT